MDLVRHTYAQRFGADVWPSPDAFLAGCPDDSSDSLGSIDACTGLTFGSSRRFFAEQYLDEPIEAIIARQFGGHPDRKSIVEVGALASRRSGAGQEIIRATPVVAWYLGMHYILCTATSALSKAFKRLEIPFTPIHAAQRERLADSEQDRWGKYYEAQPQTGVISLRDAAFVFAGSTGRYSFVNTEGSLRVGHEPESLSSLG